MSLVPRQAITVAAWTSLTACSANTTAPSEDRASRTGDAPTATVTAPGNVLEVACRMHSPDAVRAVCDLTVAEPGPVTAVVTADGTPTRTFETHAEDTAHLPVVVR